MRSRPIKFILVGKLFVNPINKEIPEKRSIFVFNFRVDSANIFELFIFIFLYNVISKLTEKSQVQL